MYVFAFFDIHLDLALRKGRCVPLRIFRQKGLIFCRFAGHSPCSRTLNFVFVSFKHQICTKDKKKRVVGKGFHLIDVLSSRQCNVINFEVTIVEIN